MNVGYYEDEVVFVQKIKLLKKSALVKVNVDFTACTKSSCLPPDEVLFSIPVK